MKGYQYTPEGRLSRVTLGTNPGAPTLERYDYNTAGGFSGTARKGTFSYVHPDGVGGPNAVGATPDGWAFGYDAKGNQVRREGPGVTQTIDYSSFNLPLVIEQVTGSVAETFEFDYDAYGQRRVKHSERATTFYVDDLYKEIMVDGNTQVAEYSLNINGRKLGTITKRRGVSGEEAAYFMDDPTGSPLAVGGRDDIVSDHRSDTVRFGACD